MYGYVYYLVISYVREEYLKNVHLCVCARAHVFVRVIWSPHLSPHIHTHIWSMSLSYSSFLVIFLEPQKAGWDPTAIPQSSEWASLGLVMWLSDTGRSARSFNGIHRWMLLVTHWWWMSILSRSNLALLLSSISLLFMKAQKTPIQKQGVRGIVMYLVGQLVLFISSFGRKENKGLFWMDCATCSAQFSLYLMDLNGNDKVPGASPCKSSLEILHCTDQAQRHDFKHSSDLALRLGGLYGLPKTCQDQLNQLYHNIRRPLQGGGRQRSRDIANWGGSLFRRFWSLWGLTEFLQVSQVLQPLQSHFPPILPYLNAFLRWRLASWLWGSLFRRVLQPLGAHSLTFFLILPYLNAFLRWRLASWLWGSLFRRVLQPLGAHSLTFFPIFMHSLGDVWHPGSGVPCFGGFCSLWGLTVSLSSL